MSTRSSGQAPTATRTGRSPHGSCAKPPAVARRAFTWSPTANGNHDGKERWYRAIGRATYGSVSTPLTIFITARPAGDLHSACGCPVVRFVYATMLPCRFSCAT